MFALQKTEVKLENPSVQRILQAAGACFGRLGFHGVSLNEIALKAGVSKSLLHYHFESKTHLFLEVQLYLCRQFAAQVEEMSRVGQASVAQLDHAMDELQTFIQHNLDQLIVMLDFRAVVLESASVAIRMQQFHQHVLNLIEQGIYNLLGPMTAQMSLSPARLARVILFQLHGLILSLSMTTDEETQQDIRVAYGDIRSLLTRSIIREVS